MTLAELAQAIADRLELDSLPCGEDVATLYIDGLRVEMLQDREGWLWFRGIAGQAPEEDRERFLQGVLARSFGRVRKQRSTLSLAEDARTFWLHLREDGNQLQIDQVLEVLEQFVNELEFWQQFLAQEPVPTVPRGPLPFLIR